MNSDKTQGMELFGKLSVNLRKKEEAEKKFKRGKPELYDQKNRKPE